MQEWIVRKDELKAHAAELKKSLADLDPGLSALETSLDALIECYRSFIENHVDYFKTQFSDHLYYPLDEYPEEHVMRVTLDQAAFDLQVIQQIVFQRRSGANGIETLTLADYLSSQALDIARPILAFSQYGVKHHFPVAFTYFQKSPSIRLVPYTNVALIGIPFTSTTVHKDLLAIPHEVGHYVFWHGKNIRKVPFMDIEKTRPYFHDIIAKNKQADKDKALVIESGFFNWLEEIFADVYGSLVAGALISVDFQDLQLENSKDDFASDDGKHPLPVLRPFIYAEATRLSNSDEVKGKKIKSALQTRWENKPIFKKFGNQKFRIRINLKKYLDGIVPKPEPDDIKTVYRWLEYMSTDKKEFRRTELINYAEDIIGNIFEQHLSILMNEFSKLLNLPEPNFWVNFVDNIDKDFEETLISRNSEESQKVLLESLYDLFGIACSDNDIQKRAQDNLGSIKIECKNYEDLKSMWETKWPSLETDWLKVFKADGWTVKGPTKPWST
jgi:hypothetical protein